MGIKKGERFIGTQYYRPPNPDFKDWERDIACIREHGFKMIRAWLPWSKINPDKDAWDFSDYDRVFEIASKNRLSVFIQIISESSPQWFIAQHPDACLCYPDGSSWIPEVGNGMAAGVGGYPGLSPDVPEVRDAIEEFLRRTVGRYKGHPALYCYDIWNEMMPYYEFNPPLYHPATQEKFRKWLKRKYGSIEKLNSAWGGWSFTSMDQVSMNPKGNFASLLDMHLFFRDWLADLMAWKVKVVRNVDSKVPFASHAAGGVWQLLAAPHDLWDMAELVDIWGLSDYESDFYRSNLFMNGIASSSHGKPWWLSEQTGGRKYKLFGHAAKSPQFVEQKMLQAFSFGADANLVWQWRPERFGQESPNFGLTNEDGTPNANTIIVSRLARALDKNKEIFSNLKFEKPDVGLVIDWRLRSWEWSAYNDPCRFGEKELLGWHTALTEIGANVEILNLERIAHNGMPQGIKIMILPLCIQDAHGLQERLVKFVKTGGHLIAGPYFLTFLTDTYMSPDVPPKRMQKLFGSRRTNLSYSAMKSEDAGWNYTEVPFDTPSDIRLTFLPGIACDNELTIEGYHLLETYELTSAIPISHTGTNITGTMNSAGKGVAYRIGSLLGTRYNKCATKGLAIWLKHILSLSGCNPFPPATDGVITRLGNSGKKKVLFVSNPHENEVVTWIHLSEKVRSLANLITGDTLSSVSKGQFVLHLKPRETMTFSF